MRAKPHVLIAGAGIGGLTAAVALLDRGFRVSIFERVPQLREIGAGFHCTPNGTRVLHALGLKEAIGKVAVRLEDRDIRLWNTGRAWKLAGHGAESEARYGAPYLLFHRGDLHAILAEAVRDRQADAVHLNAPCHGFAQDSDGVVLKLEDGREFGGDVLVGADGVHSAVRKALFGPDNPRFTGEVAWRGLVPVDRLPERMRGRVTSNWIGPSGSVTVYPVRRGELVNFVGLVERDDWRVESWIEEGTIGECARDFHGWHEDIHTLIGNIETPFKWALFLRDPQPRWSIGRVTLLGDACHAMVPYLGQGANMAIEDAYVLARCLDEVPNVESALARYENARRARATEMVLQSSQQSKRIHDRVLADPAKAVSYIETNWAPEKVKGRYDWIFDYDAAAVPV
jgi:salicylate hydroxylase